MLKSTELEDGKIYKAISSSNGYNYIFKNINKGGYEFYITGDIYRAGPVQISFSWNSWNLELASLEECIWMEECIKQNKFIPFSEIVVNQELQYEIF